jgi:hypothetical protein
MTYRPQSAKQGVHWDGDRRGKKPFHLEPHKEIYPERDFYTEDESQDVEDAREAMRYLYRSAYPIQ